MKIFILFLILFVSFMSSATTYTEFYIQSTADGNLNAGDSTNDAALFTYSGGTFDSGTGVFTPASGNPLTDGVVTNTWASIYTTAGATNANFVSRVTAVDATTITVSLTAIGGAIANVSTSAGASTLKYRGAWKGPNTNEVLSAGFGHPSKIAVSTMTNYGGYPARFNFRNDSTYNTTNTITWAGNGPYVISGYNINPGDGGRAIIDGSGFGLPFTLLIINGTAVIIQDFILANNGAVASTTCYGLQTGGKGIAYRVTAHGMNQTGLRAGSSGGLFLSCEAYGCNVYGAAGVAGIDDGSANGTMFVNCISYSNIAANVNGFNLSGAGSTCVNCLAYKNTLNGFRLFGIFNGLLGCDSYANGGSGLDYASGIGSGQLVENCNFLRNTNWGIGSSIGSSHIGMILNCGFGSGSMANSYGPISTNITTGGVNGLAAWSILNTNTYAAGAYPWTDPDNGNFSIKSGSSAKSSGYGTFFQTFVNYPTNTIGYPDIGAAQSSSTNATTTSEHSHVFAQ